MTMNIEQETQLQARLLARDGCLDLRYRSQNFVGFMQQEDAIEYGKRIMLVAGGFTVLHGAVRVEEDGIKGRVFARVFIPFSSLIVHQEIAAHLLRSANDGLFVKVAEYGFVAGRWQRMPGV